VSLLAVLLLFAQLAASGQELSAEEYLGRLRTALKRASAAVEDPSDCGRAARSLEALEEVRVRISDRETVTVRNHWVGEAIEQLRNDRTGEAARRVLARLRAIENEVKELRSNESPVVTAELAEGEEFGDAAAKPGIEDVDLGIKRRLRSVAEWLHERLEREPSSRRPVSIGIPRAVAWVIAVAVVCVLVFFIVRHIMKGRAFSRPEFAGGPRVRSLLEDALKRTPEQWKELARQYFDKGDLTQALRALYLGLLVVLHRKRLISYESSRTNWEYVWELGTAKPEHKPFAELTRAFDYKWYGREACSRGDYLALESKADEIINAPAQTGAQGQ
jgi:hypothetical protein